MNKKWRTILIVCFITGGVLCLVLTYFAQTRRDKGRPDGRRSLEPQQLSEETMVKVELAPQEQELGSNSLKTDEEDRVVTRKGAVLPPSNTVFKLDQGGGKSWAFKNQREAEAWMRREELRRLRDRGGDDQTAFVLQESWGFQDTKAKNTTLNRWLSSYDGKMFDPVTVFDATKEYETDFSTPISSLQSYWHAMHGGDAKALLSNADGPALKMLRNHFGVNEKEEKDTYFPGQCKKFTVFFLGRTTIGGTQYVLVFYRREVNTNPKQNRVSFHTTFFKRLQGKYQLSEAPRGSRFADVYSVMGAKGIYPAGPYPKLHEKLSKTAMPKSFYTIE